MWAVASPLSGHTDGQGASVRYCPAMALDTDTLNAKWDRAVQAGLVAPYGDEPDTWALTDAGEAAALRKVLALGIDPDTLSASQFISVAAYGMPDMGDPVA